MFASFFLNQQADVIWWNKMHGRVYTFTQLLKGHAPGTLGLNINLMDGCWGLGDSPLGTRDVM